MKILVVENEKKIAAFVRKGLEAAGFVVDVSHHGDEGYKLANTSPYDAIILDIMLPGRDGLSILKNLRERKMAVPVILLTARSELNERLEGLNLGADDYLTKPFFIEELIAAVTSAGLDRRIPLSDEDPEIRRLIETLNHMMDRLEKGFHQATRFSADASHELKTPIAIMRGELENALLEASPGSREQKLLSSLLDETQRLAGITRSLLLLSRADAGQLVLAIEEIDLSRMLPELLEDTEVLATAAEIEVQARIAPDIRVMVDPLLLRSALLNVLTNAVKHNEPGDFIHVDLEADGQEAKIRIANSGPGIPPDEQALIFDRFQRADRSRERRIDGIGLGLSLTREILHAHHGSVELEESRPGLTRIAIRLPIHI